MGVAPAVVATCFCVAGITDGLLGDGVAVQ